MNLLLVNVFATSVASGIARVVLYWIILNQFGTFALSTLVFSTSSGQLLGSITAGSITDRYDRRTIVSVTSWLSSLLFASIVIIPLQNVYLLTLGYLLATAAAFAIAIHDNAARTLIPAFSQSDEIERANGRFLTAAEIGSFLGPMLAGWALVLFDGALVMAAASGLCLVAAISFQVANRPALAETSINQKEDITASLAPYKYACLNGWLALGLLLGVLANLLILPISMVLIPIRISQEGLGPTALGFFYGALSVGFATAGFTKKKMDGESATSLRLVQYLIYGALSYLLSVFFSVTPIIFVCGFMAGYTLAQFEISWNSMLQRRSPQQMLGRLYSFGSWTSFAARSAGTFLAGLAVARLEAQFVIYALVATFLVTSISAAIFYREKRHIITQPR